MTPGDSNDQWATKEAQYAAELEAFETHLEGWR